MTTTGEKPGSAAGGTPSKSHRWTEQQKLALLFSIIDTSVNKVEWSKVDLPEGRTIKAAQCMFDVERKKARGDGAAGSTPGSRSTKGDATASNGDGETSTKRKRGPKKATANNNNGDAAEGDATEQDTPTKKPKSGGRKSAKKASGEDETAGAQVKAETGENDEELSA